MKKVWNIGIIGLGGIAQMSHLRAFGLPENSKIIAGCDLNPDNFKVTEKEWGLNNFYTNYIEMMEKEKPDAVVVGTPNFTHKDISIAALRRNISVLCEKPVCRTAPEAEELRREVKASKAHFMIGQCMRFRKEAEKIKTLIAENKLGRIYYCKACYLRQRGIPGFGTWFTDSSRAHGGVILDLGVHMLDYIWYLLGKPPFKSVSAMKSGNIGRRKQNGEEAGFDKSEYPSTYRGPEKQLFDVEEAGAAFIRFENGTSFQLEVSWAMNIEKDISQGMILGDKGGVTLSPVIYTHEQGTKMLSEELPVAPEPSADIQARVFLDLLAGKIPNPVPIDEGVTIMKVLDAVYESAASNKEITLN